MNSAVTIALSPLASLYGVAMKARRALYQAGRFRIHELGVPVISVGNLTTGGTGKTPLVEWIARDLAQTGRRVCILTRGYGRQRSGTRVIVSDGSEVNSDAAQAGDEPLLLAERLRGLAAVIADPDRVAAARWATENLRTNVFVLDDGFQHLRVARSLNILTIDATNPWGNGKLLPAGVLRESPAELARADCVVITRADDPASSEELRLKVLAQSKDCPIFCSRMMFSGLRSVQSDSMSLDAFRSLYRTKRSDPSMDGGATPDLLNEKEIRAAKVAAFCGLGNPESFFSLLRLAGFQVVHTQSFRDHHSYTQEDVDRVERDSVARGAEILLTTAKDEVKLRSLRFELPCYSADIAIEIENQEKFRVLIAAATAMASVV